MNPEIKKLRQRTAAYLETHPQYKEFSSEQIVRRRKMKTRKHLRPGTRCTYCGKLLSTYTATIDHIIPISRGGTNDSDNLCWCCKKCNKDKGNKLLEEWKCM